MAYKLFPYSHDGKNQFRVTFDTYNEQEAFEKAIRILNDMAADFKRLIRAAENGQELPPKLKGVEFEDRRGKEHRPITSGFFYCVEGEAFAKRFTSLMYEVVRDHWEVVRQMVPFHVFNFDHNRMNWAVFADEIEEAGPAAGSPPASEGHPHAGAAGPHGG